MLLVTVPHAKREASGDHDEGAIRMIPHLKRALDNEGVDYEILVGDTYRSIIDLNRGEARNTEFAKDMRRLPDAVIVEGPLSGGHQGFKYEECFLEENQLESILPPVVEEAKKWGDIPVIAAGGIWDKSDIERMMALGADGVQMGTRFIGTHECDASATFKETIIGAKEENIKLFKSPVGYPARGVKTNLHKMIEEGTAPKIKCISNCVAPCHRGEEAKAVGYCIADSLSDAYDGKLETGLFFTGSNGYRLKEIISVKELMDKLINGE
jgi:nitronate monooxygenase